MSNFLRQAVVSLRMLVVMTVLLGIAFPLTVFLLGRTVAHSADGSWVSAGGATVGSSRIGQDFPGHQWFHPRPSAAGDGYDALSSGGSNLAPDNPTLVALVAKRKAEIAAENGVDPAAVPADAVTASGSGLDPDISPAYAHLQAARVARARGLTEVEVTALVDANTQQRFAGFVGEPRVNVLELNIALQQRASG